MSGAKLALILAAAVVLPGLGLRADRGADAVVTLLHLTRIEEARALFEGLPSSDPARPHAEAWLRFHEGRYEDAARAVRGVADTDGDHVAYLKERIEAAARATRGMERRRIGRLEFRYAPGVDSILPDYAAEPVETQLRALEDRLGAKVPGPVVIEFFPTVAPFVDAAGLPPEWVETTNTVAICKWDRVLVLSPMNMAWGYPWIDTLAHELVHLVLSRASHNRAPIWFQEGTARSWEGLWRGAKRGAWLDPRSETLLAAARTGGTLIPFEKMHPSMAALPSATDAALAFAQVALAVESIEAQVGAKGFRTIVARTAETGDVLPAIAEQLGEGSIEERLHAEIRAMPLRVRADVGELRPRLEAGAAAGAKDGSPGWDPLLGEEPRVESLVRLGDLLRARGHQQAALIEYDKAHAVSKYHAPSLAFRRARVLEQLGKEDAALPILIESLESYPEYTPVVAMLARLYLGRDRRADAERVALQAIALNPFDPEPHAILASLWAKAGDPRAARERDVLARLEEHLGGRSATR